MKPRFQADADLDRHIVAAVKRREPMVDFQSAQDAGLTGMSDPAVLAFAASEGRVLVSHDRKTMPVHFSDFVQRSTSPGLLIVSQHLAVSAAAEELLLIWVASEAEEWINQVACLPL
jgi:predicted nuclease of predicted toxin-antitoxin system